MILVLGQARTGTSLTAGVLARLGVCLGQLFEVPDEWNQKGNFVDADISRLNHYLYQGDRLIGGKYAPPVDSMWGVWTKKVQERQAIKDHSLLPLLDHLMKVIDPKEVKVIQTTRNESDSLKSLAARRHDHDEQAAAQFQADCQVLIAEFLEKYNPPTLTLKFEDAISDPVAYAQQIADFVGVPCNQDAIEFISPELRRF